MLSIEEERRITYLLDNARIIAEHAGAEVLLPAFENRTFSAELKPDNTPVTEADRNAEAIIVGLLKKRFPEYGFLGEELGESGLKDKRWIIDPLDGTKNFIRGIPVFATLIALEEKGTITVGVVYNPATRDLWYAGKGYGAYHNGKHIQVSSVETLQKAMLLHSGIKPLKASPHWDRFLRLADKTQRQRAFGDFLGFMMVAQGQAEICLDQGPLKPWDLAAPSIIVREAGGVFSDLALNENIYSPSALATNGRLRNAVAMIL